MEVFLFVIIAILAFLGFADKERFREMFPIWISAVFIRFLDHYLIIDWFRFMVLEGQEWRTIWFPMLANLTIWPITAYLYIQYLPVSKSFVRRFLYTALYVLVMVGYLRALMFFNSFSMDKGWTIWHTTVVVYLFFLLNRLIYRWLTQPVRGGVSNG